MNSKNTKKRLVASVVAMAMCLTMFIGSTFAWFTDTASTGVNTITSGNLDIELRAGTPVTDPTGKVIGVTYSDEVTNNTPVFDEDALWEPGHVEVVYLQLKNVGNLALKYEGAITVPNEKAGVNKAGETFKLSQYLKYGVVESDTSIVYADRNAAMNAVTEPQPIKAKSFTGEMKKNNDDVKYFAIIVYMPENVGNEANFKTAEAGEVANKYQPTIDLGIIFNATQTVKESDSFDNTYDQNATLPVLPVSINTTVEGTVSNSVDTVLEDSVNNVTATIPANAVAENKDIEFTVTTNIDANNNNEVTYNIDFKEAETGSDVSFSSPVTVKWYIGKNLTNVTVTHNNTDKFDRVVNETELELADKKFYYDPTTGMLTVCSSSYSPYTITFEDANAPEKVKNTNEFQAAVKNVINGGTISIAEDMAIAGNTDGDLTNTGKTINIDLNGKTVTGANQNIALRVRGNSVGNIKNGTVSADANTWSAISAAGNETGKAIANISNMTLSNSKENGNCVRGFDNSEINIQNTTINSSVGGCVEMANGTLNIQSGTFTQTGKTTGEYDANSMNVAVNSGGTANIYGGTYTSETYGLYVMNSGGTMNVYGGTFKANKAVLIANEKDADAVADCVFNIYGGSFDGKIWMEEGADLNIFAGTFTGTGLTLEQFKTYVAEGNSVTEADDVFTVTKK